MPSVSSSDTQQTPVTVSPGAPPGANVSFTENPASPTNAIGATWDQELDAARGTMFLIAVSQLVLGIVGVPFCWIGYGFVAFMVILLIIFGSIGVAHFSNLAALRYGTCCCVPLNAVRQLHTCYVVTLIFAVLAVATSVIQAVMEDDNNTVRIFAIITVIHSLLSTGNLICGIKYGARLRTLCLQDDAMVNPVNVVPPGGQQPAAGPAYYAGNPYYAPHHAAARQQHPGAQPQYAVYAVAQPAVPPHGYPPHHHHQQYPHTQQGYVVPGYGQPQHTVVVSAPAAAQPVVATPTTAPEPGAPKTV